MHTRIRIQTEDFDQGSEYRLLAHGSSAGAVVTFVGRVRDFAGGEDETLWLEHYLGMTEKVLEDLAAQARQGWELIAARFMTVAVCCGSRCRRRVDRWLWPHGQNGLQLRHPALAVG